MSREDCKVCDCPPPIQSKGHSSHYSTITCYNCKVMYQKMDKSSTRKSQKKSHSTLRAKRATFTFLVNKSWLNMLVVTDRTVRVRVRVRSNLEVRWGSMVRSNHEVRSTEPKSNLIPTKIPIFWKSKSKQSEIDKKIFIFGEEKFYKKNRIL